MASIGEILAEARRQKGITPKDVEKSIKIRAKYISALEENDFETIPGQAYVVGFIKTYANYLGLDGANLITRYREEYQPKTQVSPYYLQPEPGRRRSVGLLRLAAIVGLLVVIGYLVFGGWRQDGVKSRPAANRTETPSTRTIEPQIKQFTVTVRVIKLGGSWLRVMVDGNEAFKGVLSEGERSWNAEQEVRIKANKATAVEILRDGKSVGLLDPNQNVTEKVYKLAE